MRQRFRGQGKEKRDGWVKQMAEDMPQLTQKEIAQRFGLGQSAVSRILSMEKRVEELNKEIHALENSGKPGTFCPELIPLYQEMQELNAKQASHKGENICE